MLRVRSFLNYRRVLALLAIVVLTQTVGYGQSQRPRRIAGFGSSVANGSGDEYGKEGYIGLLRTFMAQKGWEVAAWRPGPKRHNIWENVVHAE